MRWLLVYRDDSLGDAWRAHFAGQPGVGIIGGDICAVECNAVVSPANSFGFMDGGLDRALSVRFGEALQSQVQQATAVRPLRELLVGEAMLAPTGDAHTPWLVSAPTMRVPMRLRQSVNAYLAMKAILASTMTHAGSPPIRSVAIPRLGTGVGGLPAKVAARQMWFAFSETVLGARRYPADLAEAQVRHVCLNPEEINLWDP
ncbi:MAG: macro domain-containing protein [Planctomycetes bacterium]|nr:macro domain-containing protein [Planctomycetota bacterium]